MKAKVVARRAFTEVTMPLQTAFGRLSQYGPRPPRFSGAYSSFAEALAAVPPTYLAGYDNDGATEVSVAAMTQVHLWDYPMLFWLQRLLKPGMTVLDAGGHLATKYSAFGRLLDLTGVRWVIFDLPAVVRKGRVLQAEGRIPPAVTFCDTLADCPKAEILLASGLLQYLDTPFADLLAGLSMRPEAILLNKVATRAGPEVVTLERIGPALVPYRIRNCDSFDTEIADLGFSVADSWQISELSHRIATHPRLGRSVSRGFAVLKASASGCSL